MDLHCSSGVSAALGHLTVALQIIDSLDSPAAAAHVLAALDCLHATPPLDLDLFKLELNPQVDFSFLDYRVEKLFG